MGMIDRFKLEDEMNKLNDYIKSRNLNIVESKLILQEVISLLNADTTMNLIKVMSDKNANM